MVAGLILKQPPCSGLRTTAATQWTGWLLIVELSLLCYTEDLTEDTEPALQFEGRKGFLLVHLPLRDGDGLLQGGGDEDSRGLLGQNGW